MAEGYRTDNENSWVIDFGRNLQNVILSKNVTQSKIAEQLGITNAMLSRYIHGTATPSVYRITQIANALDCGISDLVKIRYE